MGEGRHRPLGPPDRTPGDPGGGAPTAGLPAGLPTGRRRPVCLARPGLLLPLLLTLGLAGNAGGTVSRPATAERAGSAEYLVLAIDGAGDATALAWRVVEVAALPSSLAAEVLAAAEKQAADDGAQEVLSFQLIDGDGRVLHRGVAHVPRTVRGEHHGQPRANGHAIDARIFPVERRLVTLRLPHRPRGGGRDLLLLGGMARGALELGDLRARGQKLPLSRWTHPARPADLPRPVQLAAGPSHRLAPDRQTRPPAPDQAPEQARDQATGPTLRPAGRKTWGGDPANRVNLLILGDGYTAAQEATFAADAARLRDQLLAVSPYAEYAAFVDVAALFVPSPESGADHPAFRADCAPSDPSCCADTAAQGDPLAGTFRNTALGARFCAFGLQRLLVVDAGAAFAAASAVADWDYLLVVVNDATYGGSGGFVSVVSNHPDAVEVARHEYGHSFTALADEYETPFPSYPACSDRDPAMPPCEANVTDETARPLLKWEPWIHPATPVPTPAGTDAVGLFEGARYQQRGMYRPRHDCMMRALGVPFCEVCRQAYVDRLYRGGWGVPALGIDPVEPGSERPPPGPVPPDPAGITFAVDLVTPDHPLALTWSVDGEPVPGAGEPVLHLETPAGTTRVVELSVRDPGPFVHPDLGGDAPVSSRRWLVGDHPAACRPDEHTLCLLEGRYRAVVEWENQYNGDRGRGLALPQGELTGFFAFDDRQNVELMMKLVDFGDVVKLFYGQLTDLRFTLTVSEVATGATRVYRNAPGNCGAIDQTAFPKAAAPGIAPEARSTAAACAPGPHTLCLLDGRFAVEVAWHNQFDDSRGQAAARALGRLAGVFSFSDPANVEVLTKTLDFGDRILFLYGSLSDLEYGIRVTDTTSGAVKVYDNPPGRYCGGIDPNAF
jgi:hypothetical protein